MQSLLQKTTYPNLQSDSKSGEQRKPADPESHQVQLPTGEEILKNSKQLPPRVLKISQEEFYQWRQVIGLYKKQMKELLIKEIQKP